MKVKIKNPKEVIDVKSFNIGHDEYPNFIYVDTETGDQYLPDELEIIEDIKENTSIDWEQRRYELAKAAMQGILSNQHQADYAYSQSDYDNDKHIYPVAFAQYAVACADALIVELKKK